MKARSSTRNCGGVKVAGTFSRMRLNVFGAVLFETLATGLLLFVLLPSRLGIRVDGDNTARMMYRAFRISANGARSACPFAVDHDGWL
jgi:hypothetical protein